MSRVAKVCLMAAIRIIYLIDNLGLLRAVAAKRPRKGLIHHSDRGSQYCADDYQTLLNQFGMTASMSRKGNCYDNAPMESFWGTLKQDLSIKSATGPDKRQCRISQNISRSSTTGSEDRQDLDICPQRVTERR